MQTVLFSIGPFSVHLFGVFIGLAILAGLYIVTKEARRKGMNESLVFDLSIFGFIFAIIGARFYYVLVFQPKYFLNNPKEIFSIQNGGLSIQGGLISVILFAVIFLKVKGVSFWKIADTFAPALILGQAIGRIGCDVFGVPMESSFFWGVNVGGEILHPVQIYESLLNYVLFMFLWNYRDQAKYNGQLFLFYLMGFSVNRAIVEFFRVNPIVSSIFTVVHVMSFIIILICLFFMVTLKKSRVEINQINSRVKMVESLIIVAMAVLSIIIYYNLY